MSATLTRLKKRAAELELKKQFDKALDVYVQILEVGGKELGDDDVPLFNRVGDMLMRKGNVSEALGYYERAVDVYAERGFLNNAIALCSKILRQSPGRAAVYYKLGRISARKGFKSDARKNFLEYADRMQKSGLADEAFRALKEFASLYPDQDDVRLILAELLSQANRKDEALEQLQSLYEKLETEGRGAEARATVDRMKAIDPDMQPRVTGSQAALQPPDLIFLDLSEVEAPGPVLGAPAPTPADLPATSRPALPVVPALDGLTITFVPDEDEPESEPLSHPPGFEATLAEDEAEEDSGDGSAGDPVPPAPVEGLIDGMAADGEIQALDDLEPTSQQVTPPQGDLVAPLREQPPLSGSEFAGLDLEEVPRRAGMRTHDLALPGELPTTPETVITIGVTPNSPAAAVDAQVAAEEEADLVADITARQAGERATEPGVLQAPAPMPDDELAATSEEDLEGLFFGAADAAAAADGAVPGAFGDEGDADEDLPIDSEAPAPEDRDEEAAAASFVGDDDARGALFGVDASEGVPFGGEAFRGDTSGGSGEAGDFLAAPPDFGASEEEGTHAFPPLYGLASSGELPGVEVEGEAPPTASLRMHTPRSTLSLGGAEQHLRRRLELEPENWALRRQLGEALLDVGNRDGGLYELELAMVGFELDEDVDRASEVVDVILVVSPGSVRHHQKRVEYAVRARDRGRLIHGYLELADALFRTGTADKAVAVYLRVLELDGSNERAEFALATLAPDEVMRRRGGASRPERWSDELEAIPGSGLGSTGGAAGGILPAGSPVSIGAVLEVVEASQALEGTMEEGEDGVDGQVAVADAAQDAAGTSDRVKNAAAGDAQADTPPWFRIAEEEAPLTAVELPQREWFGTPTGDFSEDAPDARTDEHQAVPAEEAPEADEREDAEAPADEGWKAEGADASDDRPDGATVPSEAAVESWVGEEPWHEDEPASVGEPVEPGATTEDAEVPADQALPPHEPSVADGDSSGVPPAPAGPEDTSAPVGAIRQADVRDGMTRLERARRQTPAMGGDSDFVDLGEWLRLTEPVKSTRMLVDDPQPTGDEQADFQELLRRFKRGVAENVEAEDYEAHYDLGVAFKEMGLIDDAIAQFQKSLRGATHRVRSYEALGQCFVEKEQYPIAAALLQRATELPGTDDQQLVGVLYLLGFATEYLGRPADALPYYLRVFAVDIEFRDIADRVAAMGGLAK